MKVGDYVRSDKGEIGKITTIAPKDVLGLEDEYNDLVAYNTEPFVVGNIIKTSPNIIDLIEVGDYVNGHLVIDIAEQPKKAIYIEDAENKLAHIPYVNSEIKSIITKEQFKEMEYEIIQ